MLRGVVGGQSDERGRRPASKGPGCLTVVRGGRIGLAYRIGEDKLIIGRGDAADVVVTGDGVSRRHAELSRDPSGAVQLVDLGSRNGTNVNRVKIATVLLHDGDRIRIGDVDFDFRYEKTDDRATVDLAASPSAPVPGPGDSVSRRFVSTMSNLARVHAGGGRFDDALATYERARATLESKPGADMRQLVAALVGIGECQLKLGAPQLALDPLQRAVDLLQARGATARELAAPRFQLAMALGTDSKRAAEVARAARDALDPNEKEDRALCESIDAWLRSAGASAT